jgi:guanosine-3',5'-bis(diphosphate) 3'-pyrophosphohydrolase
MNKLGRAEKFAKQKHKGQMRKDGKTPYWKHLQQVVINLRKLGVKDQDVLCAGWLHDTIEDTTTDYDDLEEKFGKKVAEIVSQVTKDKRLSRKKRELQYVKQLAKSSLDAKLVKLCDIVANIVDLENSGYSMQKKKKQVDDKLRYFSSIKQSIVMNKMNLVGIDQLLMILNNEVGRYRKIMI